MRNSVVILCVVLSACALRAVAQTQSTTRPAGELDQLLSRFREVMDSGKVRQVGRPEEGMSDQDFNALTAGLIALPPLDDRRLAALEIAGQYANAAELSAKGVDHKDHHANHMRLGRAWSLLQSLGVLREGADAENLVAILGKPVSRNSYTEGTETWRWYYGSGMHVNPGLDITFKNGRMIKCECVRA